MEVNDELHRVAGNKRLTRITNRDPNVHVLRGRVSEQAQLAGQLAAAQRGE